MALITCPECGKEVSDKCRACIHCGFPLINTKCDINGVVYDFENELRVALRFKKEEYLYAVGMIRRKTNLDSEDAFRLLELIREIQNIPVSYKPLYPCEDRSKYCYSDTNDDNSVSSSVECPYCHGRNTRRISGASKLANTAFFGLLGTKRYKEWHCNNCGSDF